MMEKDPFTGKVIACAIEVHRLLGPGLLESTYQQCLAHELHLNEIDFKLEHPMPVDYKGVLLDCGYRIDLLVDGRLILELKAVEEVSGIHQAQLLTYMKLSGIKTRLLISAVKIVSQKRLGGFVQLWRVTADHVWQRLPGHWNACATRHRNKPDHAIVII